MTKQVSWNSAIRLFPEEKMDIPATNVPHLISYKVSISSASSSFKLYCADCPSLTFHLFNCSEHRKYFVISLWTLFDWMRDMSVSWRWIWILLSSGDMTHEVDGQVPAFRRNVLSMYNTKMKALRTSEDTETVLSFNTAPRNFIW